ncbi:MAG TPA: choice-of-anchor U domain-containing protein [Usitatibacter sp.]|jgi:hypothetical protein
MKRFGALAASLLLLCLSPLASAATFVTFAADPGDPTGIGSFTSGAGTFTVSVNARGGVSVVFDGAPPNIHLDFGPMAGHRFDPGRYEIPQAFPAAIASRPAMEVWREANPRCSTLTGRFNVVDLTYNFDGSIASFGADFEQHCNAGAPALRGGIRFNSAIPYAPPTFSTAVSGDTAGGPVVLSVSAATLPCDFRETQFIDASESLPVARFPYGIFAFIAAGCDPGYGAATFSLDLPEPLPEGALFWKYGPTPDNIGAHWYTLPYTTSGNTVSFVIQDGGLGDDDLTQNGVISSYGGFSLPSKLQDMWWGGPAENGWGMSIAQHGSVLFSVIYAYDADGSPIWFVMPGGTWEGPLTSYTGPIYRPQGPPFYAYNPYEFAIGAPVGTATIAFSDADHAKLSYTIGNSSGEKEITRQLFGPPDDAENADFGDMWWGDEQLKGEGFSVMQQYSTLFTVWFTYDSSRMPRWYVVPGGSWVDLDPNAHRTYAGTFYRTHGSPWVGRSYDPSQLQVTPVGTLQMHFDGDAAVFDYVLEGHAGRLNLVRQPF